MRSEQKRLSAAMQGEKGRLPLTPRRHARQQRGARQESGNPQRNQKVLADLGPCAAMEPRDTAGGETRGLKRVGCPNCEQRLSRRGNKRAKNEELTNMSVQGRRASSLQDLDDDTFGIVGVGIFGDNVRAKAV